MTARREGRQGQRTRSDRPGRGAQADTLIRVCDLAGRPRGTGFLADAEGTMVTSHEAVDGLARLVLHAPGGQVCLVEAAAVTALPETGLALVATEGLALPPLPIAPTGPAHPDRRVRLRLPYPAEGAVVGATAATYTATDRFHLLDEVYELALDGVDMSRLPPQVSGTPLLDAATGAVLGVVATALALNAGHRAAGFALPLHARSAAPAPLAALLARNAAAVPAHGPHLNLAGALQLTGASAGSAAGAGPWREPVARPEAAAALEEFLAASDARQGPLVLGLVGEPGTGRSTELARFAARRAHGPLPAPTLWLRGAELRPGDGGLKDAVERALRTAARVVGAAADPAAAGDPPHCPPDDLARLARACGRPLAVLLDAPEEMPPVLAHALADWTSGTAHWLRTTGARLVVACRPEFWEQAGALLPPELLYDPGGPHDTAYDPLYAAQAAARTRTGDRPAAGRRDGSPRRAGAASADRGAAVPTAEDRGAGLGPADRGAGRAAPGGVAGKWDADRAAPGPRAGEEGAPARRAPGRGAAEPPAGAPARKLPPCLRLGDLTAGQAERARARYGLPPGSVADADAAHPLTLRLLSEVRAALPEPDAPGPAGAPAAPGRLEVFSAYLDLLCLRVAARLAAASEPPPRGTEVRRLAARVAGQVHEAARRCLGPGQGELDREAFEELFPWRTGWASAVLSEGLLTPAGAGYRFAHEGLADWLQALHLDLDAALYALVHRWFAVPGAPAEAPVRLPYRPAARALTPPAVPPAPAVAPPQYPRSLPVPRHRAGAVVQALLLASPAALAAHLHALVEILDQHTPPRTRCTSTPPPAVLPPSADLDADTVPNPRRVASAAARRRTPPPGDTPPAPSWPPAADPPRALAAPSGSGASHGSAPSPAAGAEPDPPSPDAPITPNAADPAHPGADPAGGGSPDGGAEEAQPEGAAVRRGGGACVGTYGGGARLPGDGSWPGYAPGSGCGCAAAADGPGGDGGGSSPGGAAGPPETAYAGQDGEAPGAGNAEAACQGRGGVGTARSGGGGDGEAYPDGAGAGRAYADGGGAEEACAGRGGAGDAYPPGVGRTAHGGGEPAGGAVRGGLGARRGDAVWWGVHLVREAVLRGTGAEPYRDVLRELAGRVVVRAVECGGFSVAAMGALGEFGPWFWRRAPLPLGERLELLRVLLPADGPPGRPAAGGRFLTAAADLLRDHPAEAIPAVCGWLDDDRPLQTGPRAAPRPRPTVAAAAQALLHTHRRLAVDDLLEALVAAGRPGADELLAALAEDEPSALCRAVDRWAHDPRPDRHAAAAAHGPRAARHARSEADRELLRHAALALLARPGDRAPHAAALGMLVRDPATRSRHLPAALRHFTAGGPGLHPGALVAALATHPEPVLAAFTVRLRVADEPDAAAVLAELAAPPPAAPARRIAALVADHLRRRPEHAAAVARHLDLRLEQGSSARAALLPLAAALTAEQPPRVRRVLAPVFAAAGTHVSRPLRQELLDALLETERDPDVLDALLTAAADGAGRRHPLLTRDLVHRLGLLLGRTPEGAARFDRRIVELAAAAPYFAGQVREWLTDGGSWDAVIGPSARRRLDTVA